MNRFVPRLVAILGSASLLASIGIGPAAADSTAVLATYGTGALVDLGGGNGLPTTQLTSETIETSGPSPDTSARTEGCKHHYVPTLSFNILVTLQGDDDLDDTDVAIVKVTNNAATPAYSSSGTAISPPTGPSSVPQPGVAVTDIRVRFFLESGNPEGSTLTGSGGGPSLHASQGALATGTYTFDRTVLNVSSVSARVVWHTAGGEDEFLECSLFIPNRP